MLASTSRSRIRDHTREIHDTWDMDQRTFTDECSSLSGATTDGCSRTFETLTDGFHDGVLIDECPSSAKASTDGCNDGEVPPDGC